MPKRPRQVWQNRDRAVVIHRDGQIGFAVAIEVRAADSEAAERRPCEPPFVECAVAFAKRETDAVAANAKYGTAMSYFRRRCSRPRHRAADAVARLRTGADGAITFAGIQKQRRTALLSPATNHDRGTGRR